jgi:hypothetical protein
MVIRIKHWLALAVVAAASLTVQAVDNAAEAARWRTCNGSPVIWRGTLNVHRNRCSIPDTGLINSAYWNGVRQWDDPAAEVDGFFVNAASDCFIGFNDGQNEVGLVNRAAIDGANGLAVSQLGLCFIGSNDIDEVDVMVANDLPFDIKPGSFIGSYGRATFVHEFGHFFGFLHDDGPHGVMRTFSPRLLTGGNEPATTWPNDALGMSLLYGFPIARSNLLPGSTGVSGGGIATLDPAAVVNVCRGSTNSTRMFLGNNGNAGSGTYNLRVRLNATAPTLGGYNLGTTVAQNFTHSIGAFGEGTFALGFTVPRSLPNGDYFIYVDMDHSRTLLERREGDNSTVSAKKLRVSC